MVKSIYVEGDNLKPAISWLETRPTGICQLWIGDVKPETQPLMDIIDHDYLLAEWLFTKMKSGELYLKVTPFKAELPIGVLYDDSSWKFGQ